MKLAKSEVLKLMESSAKIYKEKFEDTALMLVYKKGTLFGADAIEIKFKDENFLHLTGVTTGLSAKEFYNNIINNKLSLEKFEKTKYTEMKLRVLNVILGLQQLSCQIGTYKGNRPYLKADIIVGKKTAVLGLVKVSSVYYAPRTVIEESTENIIENPAPNIAIFKKKLGAHEKYEETYRNPKYATDFYKYMESLPIDIKNKI